MISQGAILEVLKKTSKYQKSTFALNVISKRESMGMTAEKFAEFADIPYPTLRDLEVGRTGGSARTKQKIAMALGCTIDELNTPSHLKEKSVAHDHAPQNSLARLIAVLPSLDETELRAILESIADMRPDLAAVARAE